MTNPDPNLPLAMTRPNLEDLPHYPIVAPYTLRYFQAGDQAHWIDIHEEADQYSEISLATFERSFGIDETILAQRQIYLCDKNGRPIGTASAWFGNPEYGADWGQIHWVAIRPAYQGNGLAKPLLSLVCRRLRELGHQQTYLYTSTARIPAINLYLNFGFVPEIRATVETDCEAWALVKQSLSHPALAAV